MTSWALYDVPWDSRKWAVLRSRMTSAMNKSPLAKRYPGVCVVRWNDDEINVWLKCVLVSSVTEMIKVIKKGEKKQVKRGRRVPTAIQRGNDCGLSEWLVSGSAHTKEDKNLRNAAKSPTHFVLRATLMNRPVVRRVWQLAFNNTLHFHCNHTFSAPRKKWSNLQFNSDKVSPANLSVEKTRQMNRIQADDVIGSGGEVMILTSCLSQSWCFTPPLIIPCKVIRLEQTSVMRIT